MPPSFRDRAQQTDQDMSRNRRKRWGHTAAPAAGYRQPGNNNSNRSTTSTVGTSGTDQEGYYGPARAGRSMGRGGARSPMTPARAAAIASNQRGQDTTQLVSLTGQRTGGEITSSSQIRDSKGNSTSGTNTISQRLEMQKTTPSEVAEGVLRRIQGIEPTKLTIQDFTTPDSNDGKSILITSLINHVVSLRPELGEAQRARIAAHAAVHHSLYLYEAFMDGDVAIELTKSFLATRPVRLTQEDLCPMDTPYLLIDTELREHLGQLVNTPPSELRRIITPFLQCFYPSDWELLEQTIMKASSETLQELISTPGAIHHFFITSGINCTFAPPQWLSLSAFNAKQGNKSSHSPPQGSQGEDSEDEESVDSRELMHPLREMRIDQAVFDTLPPESQKKQILAVFPTRMASVIPPDVFGHLIVQLSEMSAASIRGAMEPGTFHRLIGHAKKIAIKEAELTPGPQIYFYRFRVQHLGKGYPSWANASASEILNNWIKAWIPMFSASRYTLALSKRPSDRTVAAIDLSTTQDIPTQQTLETYVYDVIRKQGNLHQFDFWIITDCPDITNKGAHSFTRSQEVTLQFQEDIRQAAIWSMKMERLPQGYIPCLFLGNSLLKDDDELIKEEIILRTGFHPKNEGKFIVEWITVSTKTEQVHAMAHCVMVKPEDHQLVSQLCTRLGPIQDVDFPVTAEYQPMVIPPRRGAEMDQELSQAIARHLEYTRALVQVSIRDIPRTNMCYDILHDHGMEMLDPDHDATIAYLLLNGTIVTAAGTRISSPATRVNMDSNRTRIYLHAPRTLARELVVFAQSVYKLLTRWYDKDISQAALDVRDAERAAIAQEREAASNQSEVAGTTSPPGKPTATIATLPTPMAQQQMITVPLDQWNQAIDIMRASAAKMDAILLAMAKMPTVISHRDALDEAVSVITQSMTLQSDLVNNRADTTVLETRRVLAERIQEVNGNVMTVTSTCESLGSRHDHIESSMAQVIQLIGDVTQKLDSHHAGKLILGATQLSTQDEPEYREEQQQRGNKPALLQSDHGANDGGTDYGHGETLTQGPNMVQIESHTQPDEQPALGGSADLQQDSEMDEHNEEDLSGVEINPTADAQDNLETGGGEEQKEDWEKDHELPGSETETERGDSPPYVPLTRCHACNKLDANIEVCDYCEIPHHLECLIQEPNGGTNRYCNECMNSLYGDIQKRSPHPSDNSDLELSESDSSSDRESVTSEFKPTTQTAPQPISDIISQPQNTAPKYSLRDRNKKKSS